VNFSFFSSKKPVHLLLGLVLITLAQGCASSRPFNLPDGAVDRGNTLGSAPLNKGDVIQEGLASWYGPNFNGRPTANGETFDMDGISAAHKTLPFNTMVRVENLDNGRTIDVRINDRGPYVGDRIIDLSKGAAEAIQMIGPGTARVRLILLDNGDAPVRPAAIKDELFTIQLAAFDSRDEAMAKAKTVRGATVERRVSNGRVIYRVFYGAYKSRKRAESILAQLERRGYSGYVRQYQN